MSAKSFGCTSTVPHCLDISARRRLFAVTLLLTDLLDLSVSPLKSDLYTMPCWDRETYLASRSHRRTLTVDNCLTGLNTA